MYKHPLWAKFSRLVGHFGALVVDMAPVNMLEEIQIQIHPTPNKKKWWNIHPNPYESKNCFIFYRVKILTVLVSRGVILYIFVGADAPTILIYAPLILGMHPQKIFSSLL